MKKTLNTTSHVLNYLGIALMLGLFALCFVPYWGQVSMQAYTWFPTDHKDLTKFFGTQLEDYWINGYITDLLVVFLGAQIGAVAVFLTRRNLIAPVVTIAYGALSALAFLTNGILTLGDSTTKHLIVSIAIAGVGVLQLVTRVWCMLCKKQ